MANERDKKRTHQINIRSLRSVQRVQRRATLLAGVDASRFALAGMVWLLQHREHRQAALDALNEFESGPNAPTTDEEVDQWLRQLARLDAGKSVQNGAHRVLKHGTERQKAKRAAPKRKKRGRS